MKVIILVVITLSLLGCDDKYCMANTSVDDFLKSHDYPIHPYSDTTILGEHKGNVYAVPTSTLGRINYEPIVDMRIIAYIESGNNPLAVGDNGDLGLYQITPIVVKEWNNFHKNKFTHQQMLDEACAWQVAYWYLGERIPKMLKHYGVPVTPKNVIWAWNAGIGNVVKGIFPKSTAHYVRQYMAYRNGV